MGLAAAQARYLFISNRTNQIENSLMKISAKQLVLSDRADDVAKRKNIAQNNTTVWTFNGKTDLGYADVMGLNSSNNGALSIVTTNNGSSSRVILNDTLHEAVVASGVSQFGGEFSDATYGKFLTKLGHTPVGEIGSWDYYTTGRTITETTAPGSTTTITKTEVRDAAIAFRNQYGSNTFNGNERDTGVLTQTAKELTDQYRDFQYYVEDYIDYDLGKTFYYSNYSMKLEPFNTFRDCIVDTYFNADGTEKLDFALDANDNFRRLRNEMTALSTLDTSGALEAMIGVLHGINDYFSDNNTNVYNHELSLYHILQGLESDYKGQPVDPDAKFKDPRVNETVKVKENEKGYVQAEWELAFNALAPDVRAFLNSWTYGQPAPPAPTITLTQPGGTTTRLVKGNENPTDRAVYEKYLALFKSICSLGWERDGNINDRDHFYSKLENGQYVVDNSLIVNNSKFKKIAVSTEATIESWYNAEIKKIQDEEKALETKAQTLQTQLLALSTEEESVKAIIDKNIERSFNLFS